MAAGAPQQSPRWPLRSSQLLFCRYVDRGAFTRGQALLFVPNLLFLGGMICAHSWQIQPDELRQPIRLMETATYLELAFFFIISLALLPSIQSTMLHAQSAVKNAPAVGGRDVAIANAGKLGPETVQMVLFAALVLLVDPKTWWIILSAILPTTCLLFLMRALSKGTVNREYGRTGEGVHTYVEAFTRRMLVFVAIFTFAVVYSTVVSLSGPITPIEGLPEMAHCMRHINAVSGALFFLCLCSFSQRA